MLAQPESKGADVVTLEELLRQTSRTFALSIPLLPEPARTDVMLGYLVFRIGDTLEDAEHLDRAARVCSLRHFIDLLEAPSPSAAEQFVRLCGESRLSEHRWYNVLVENTPLVFDELLRRNEEVSRCIFHHARRSMQGMASAVESGGPEGELRLGSIAETRQYCYFVAGIVGEMLTELFESRNPELVGLSVLRDKARWFGEGLQLVNILKDEQDDARHGRYYIPRQDDRGELFRLAREDLNNAEEYCSTLLAADIPRGYAAFTLLPLRLAYATLDRVEQQGAGAKLSRNEVFAALRSVWDECELQPAVFSGSRIAAKVGAES